MLKMCRIARRGGKIGFIKKSIKRNSKLSETGRSRLLHKTSKLTAKRKRAERAEKLLTIRREGTESPMMNLPYSPLM
jgi:hypothetical protein